MNKIPHDFGAASQFKAQIYSGQAGRNIGGTAFFEE